MSSKGVIGLLGGGQLGAMLCEAANPLNVPIAILDADNAPAKKIHHNKNHGAGSFKDANMIRELANHCDVLTVEVEHVDTTILEEVNTKGVEVVAADGSKTNKKVAVHPSWKTIRLIQNKYDQKEYFGQQGVPIAEQLALDSGDAMLPSMKDISAKFGFPWMLKSRKDSYDGRGNFKISSEVDYQQAVSEFGNLSCYAEKWVPFEIELSVMVIRTEDDNGNTKRLVPYPAVETVHEDNICSKVYMPPRKLSADVCKRAQDVACNVVGKLWGRGVFAVEMFLTKNDDVLVNEIAPRPHNSGHLTIESVPYMSQFKAQLTAILDKPLPETLTPHVKSAIMINILGGATADAHDKLVSMAESMYHSEMAVYVHLYGKESKPSRKIGHITLTGFVSVDELEKFAQPLIDAAQDMRQDRLKSSSKALRPTAAPAVAAVGASGPANGKPLVLVTMGSDSDLPVLKAGFDILNQFGVPWEVDITSAHRTPAKMGQVATEAADRGIKVIIAAAGGAAHLPGMLAAYTPLPVIGVPVKATHLDGIDSLLSIVQMPVSLSTRSAPDGQRITNFIPSVVFRQLLLPSTIRQTLLSLLSVYLEPLFPTCWKR